MLEKNRKKASTVAQARELSTWEVQAEGTGVQDHPQQHSRCLKENKKLKQEIKEKKAKGKMVEDS